MTWKHKRRMRVPLIKQDLLSLLPADADVIFFWPKEGIIGPAEDAQLQPPSDMTNRVQISFKYLKTENHSLPSHPGDSKPIKATPILRLLERAD